MRIRWVYTKIVRNMETGAIIGKPEGYWYCGSVDSCDPGPILASLSGLLTKAAPALTGVSAIGGTVGNLLNSITRGKAIGAMEKNANLSPEALAARVAGATKPLDASLVQGVENQVQADVASRGLSQAPGVFAAEESQALAPALQRNQDVALQLILRQLGIPADILANTGGGSDITNQIMMLLLKNAGATPGGGGGDTNQVPDTSGINSNIGDIIQSILRPDPGASATPGGSVGSAQSGGG